MSESNRKNTSCTLLPLETTSLLSLLSNPLHSSFITLSFPTLPLFPSSTPFIRAALAYHYKNTTMDCVGVCVWERVMKWARAMNRKWHSTSDQDTDTHSTVSVTHTHISFGGIWRQFGINSSKPMLREAPYSLLQLKYHLIMKPIQRETENSSRPCTKASCSINKSSIQTSKGYWEKTLTTVSRISHAEQG